MPRPATWEPGPAARFGTATPPSLDAIVAAVRGGTRPFDPALPDALHSAVLIGLAPGEHGAEVLLTRRSMDMRTHRGEISFPGGRIDHGESAVEAALREAHEEVGLDPSLVHVEGELEHLSTFASLSYIVPIVGLLAAPIALRPGSREVDRVMWVPLADLTRPDAYRCERWGTRPHDRLLHFFELDDETVWGATAAILVDLLVTSA